MAFGQGGFSGFGASNNNNNSSNTGTFGGFGQSSQGFGATGGGFGATSKPAFGATPAATAGGGGLFGTAGATTGASGGFGGFGAQNSSSFNTNNNPSGGTGIFGQNKALTTTPAFGAGAGTGSGAAGGGMFGNTGGASSGSFGLPKNPSGGLFQQGSNAECQGTGSVPFSAFQEKEANSNTTNHFQSISFMQPYQKFSFEELRLADYAQGRRFGNASNQAGAFGQSNFGGGGFGANTQNTATGFGASNPSGAGGMFGTATTSTSGGFGGNTQTTGFGGGGLFGAKPATGGGLFGAAATTSSQPAGGLFGTANSGAGAFGQPAQQSTGTFGGTGGGLFGQQNNQQKSGFSFGNAQNTATTSSGGFSGGFGTSTAGAGGGLFGAQTQSQNQGTGLFGNANQQQQQQQPGTGGSLFGGNNTQQQNAGFGGFGQQNQQKPSLFGGGANANAGGLFGNSQQTGQQNNPQQNPGGGLFGNNNANNQAGGSLFGNKPAASTGGGLFGNANQNQQQNPSGGLFGNTGNNNQPQQNAGGGLFGNNQQQQQQDQKPSLFGAGGGSLFGNNPQTNQGGGMFASSNNQNQSSLFGGNSNSLLGGSQQNPLQAPRGLTASINDPTPYGSASIFNGLPPPPLDNPGPIATPIANGQKQKKPAALPQYKLNPAMASRLVTPRKQQGYGFTYSTYGTPSSVSSVSSTPGGFSSSLLGGSLSRSLGKSYSTSNLRRNFDSDSDSILAPGAFSSSSSRYAGGSMKKLTIDRSLRTDLFGTGATGALPSPDRTESPRTSSILKKKVSFDANTSGGDAHGINGVNGTANGTATPSAEEQGYLRPRPSSRSSGYRHSTGSSEQSEMQQTKSTQLVTVPEDSSPMASRTGKEAPVDLSDPVPGKYYSKPPLEDLKKLSRAELRKVRNFVVGRERIGFCEFQEPVDMTGINLDDLFDKYVRFELRALTVYPAGLPKPPMGKGLNVPSLVTLENAWPRMRDKKTPSSVKSGPEMEKHVRRLGRLGDTQFMSYDTETGIWRFKVPHFTTYGLTYDDDETEDLTDVDPFQSSVLSEAPPTPTPKNKSPRTRSSPLTERLNGHDTSMASEDNSHVSSALDDTFEFKTGRRFPGAFDEEPIFDDDQEMEEVQRNGESFLDERSVSSQSGNEDEPSEVIEALPAHEPSIHDEEMDLVGSFPSGRAEDVFPKSILKAGRQPDPLDTPAKQFFAAGNDNWADQLQRTISPKKQDREALRQSQALLFKDFDQLIQDVPESKVVHDSGEIATSIDLMNSLFGKEQARKSKGPGQQTERNQGLKWPYSKTARANENDMSTDDRTFHNSFKPSWGPADALLYASDRLSTTNNDNVTNTMGLPRSAEIEFRDIRSSRFIKTRDITEANFNKQRDQAEIGIDRGVPYAHSAPWSFNAGSRYSSAVDANTHEASIWELASILFDQHYDETPEGLSQDVQEQFRQRVTKDRLSAFWARLCREEATLAVATATSAEERAIAFLSMNKVAEACNALIEGKDYRLATLVAQIGGDRTMHDDITAQIDEWRKLNVLSEISEPVRALYELLAGNTCTAVGKSGHLEDRAKNFIISERFGMSWRRAFGLKLWYSTLADEPFEKAVHDFYSDLADKEIKRPTPWFTGEARTSYKWDDPHKEQREDILWGLLKLYADQAGTEGPLSAVVGPENVSENPLWTRLSFELFHTLAPHFPLHADAPGGDRLTRDFAAELNSTNLWMWALHALLRLSDSQQRQQAMQKVLAQHAGSIDHNQPEQLDWLFNKLRIPARWAWEAKALHARAVEQDHVSETLFLLRAENWQEAHTTLCTFVAPQAIVERSYQVLGDLLDEFAHKPSNWRTGGGVYSDYLRLIQGGAGSEEGALLGRLVRQLSAMTDKNFGFLQKVALQDMSSVVGDKVLAGAGGEAKEQAWVLQLPLTNETKRTRAAELSWGYYQKVMAKGS